MRLRIAATLFCLLPVVAAARANGPVPYEGRGAFEAMDAKAPARSAVRSGALAKAKWSQLAVSAAGVRPGQTVADVGFGQGRITLALAAAVGPSGRVIARDIDAGRLAVLEQRMQRSVSDVSNIEAALSQPDDVQIAPGQVDVALLSDVYQIIALLQAETKNPFLRSLFAAMKPGGVVVVVNVATGKRWTENQSQVHEMTVSDFTRHGFAAGQRLVFLERGRYRAEILEFQRPEVSGQETQQPEPGT